MKYYFEGRNAAGKPVVRNGELDEPELPAADGGGRVQRGQEEARRRRPGRGRREPAGRGRKAEQASALGWARDEELEGLDVRFGKRKWWIGLGVGSGFGYAKGNGLEAVNGSPRPRFPQPATAASRPAAPGPASATSRPRSAS